MPENHLFEYAVIRLVPRVEREEFLNAGVILYCRDLKFLDCLYTLNKEKIKCICDDLDCSELEDHFIAFEKICKGNPGGGPIATLDIASRFRWLTATRSTVVQTSMVHPGICYHAGDTLRKLHEQLVL